jgi:hypothetical protein
MNSEDQELRETLELLREAHREAIPEAHFAAVRARVLAKLAAERRPWWRGIWAYGFAAAMAVAAVLLVGVWPNHVTVATMRPAQPLPNGRGSEGPSEYPSRTARVSKRFAGAPTHRRRQAAPAPYRVVGPPAPQPLIVKLVTNDPNIVIYWISGE